MRYIPGYRHRVQYYETDQMGVVHHSNYIRWFEEGRTDYMEKLGLSYAVMEDSGIMCPVLEVESRYLRMVYYGDTVRIDTAVQEYNGIKLTVGYEITSENTNMVHCRGITKHCFMASDGRPLSLKQKSPEFHEIFLEGLEIYKAKNKEE
ncbi:MAG: acyl-CoA thioesterase [Suipraeoptans sp.]